MSLVERIEDTIMEHLAEANKAIIGFENNYLAAKEFVDRFGEEKMAEYRRSMDSVVVAAIKAEGDKARKTLKASVKNKNLQVGLLINFISAVASIGEDFFVEVVAPVRHTLPTSLEKDLASHFDNVLYALDKGRLTGQAGDYFASMLAVDETGELQDRLKRIPEAMKLANIKLHIEMPRVRLGNYDQPASIMVEMTPSSIAWPHIPFPKDARQFFPQYKKPFILESAAGELSAWVTSASKERPSGSYICCSTKDGALGKAFSSLNVRPNSQLRIFALEPGKKYRMEKV